MATFEEQLHNDLHQYLTGLKEVDKRLPECPDVEGKWEEIAKAYIPDGIREFQNYPSASLGWMMYIGMAVAKMWDTEWVVMEQREQSQARLDSAESRQNSTNGQIYSNLENIYTFMRDKRGYDAMDEYVREEVLRLRGTDYDALEKLVGECASRVNNALMHQNFEPGTKVAFDGYVTCLHQLYLFGAAMQLKRMGYHMEKM